MSVFIKSRPPLSWMMTSTGSFALRGISVPPSSAELVFGRGHDQGEQVGNIARAGGPGVVAVEMEFAAAGCEVEESGAGGGADGQRARELQARVDERLRCGRLSRGGEPCRCGGNARATRVAQPGDGEIDPFDEGAAVDPFLARVPALDAGRVEQRLA